MTESQQLAIREEAFPIEIVQPAMQLAEQLARTDFVPKGLKGNPAGVLACMLTGREIGVGPMQALKQIHIGDNRPTLGAELMRALVLQHGHDISFEETTKLRCTVVGRRKDSGNSTTVTWTIDDAKQANLTYKDNWKKYPRAMLEARATGELCRLIFPDVLAGISYTPEEIEDGDFKDDEEQALELEEVTNAKEGVKKTVKAASKRAAAKPKEPATATPTPAPPLPPLPGEASAPEPAPVETVATTEQQASRGRTIAMRANKAGIDDYHPLIEVITNGRTNSSKELADEEVPLVMQAILDIEKGRKRLWESQTGWMLIEAEDPQDETMTPEQVAEAFNATEVEDDEIAEGEIVGDDDPEDWDGDRWREELNSRGIKVTESIRQAAVIANEKGVSPPPGNLNSFMGCGFASELFEWVSANSREA